MLKYLFKITMDILPSVVATIIGAYIVNHYIATKPATDATVAAAVSAAEPRKVDAASVDAGNIPAAGVRAKGISLKAIFDKSAADKPQEKQVDKQAEKPVEKPAEKPALAEKSLEQPEERPAETASISPDSRHRPAAPHEKTAVRVIPLSAAAQPAASVAAPSAPAPTVEAAITPDDHRDANDLARAAIERLRGSAESAPRAQDNVRLPDAAARTASVPPPTPAAQAPSVRPLPLPPPIVVSTPPVDVVIPASTPTQPNAMTARVDDPRRPIPPADIPPPAPVDLRTDKPHTNVAEDMLLAAKSMFHSVIPQ